MSRSRRRAATRIAAGLLAGALLAAAPGCATIESLFGGTHVADNPKWQLARFKGVSSSDVLRLA